VYLRRHQKLSETPFLDNLDVSVFSIFSASSVGDKQSFLRLQNLVRQHFQEYAYLEIGSDAGGSLVPLLLDPKCSSVTSVDLRPTSQPDERGVDFDYPTNGEEIMLRNLEAAAGNKNLEKLKCFKSDVQDVPIGAIPKIQLALIDGEHTNVACFSDAERTLSLIDESGVVAFHDANLITDAIQNFERMLHHIGIKHELVFLPDCVAAIGIGEMASIMRAFAAPIMLDRSSYIVAAQQHRRNVLLHEASVRQAERFSEESAFLLERASVLEAELIEAKSENRNLRSSNSWKITAPLRYVTGIFRK
jgi:hypothetical protein